VRLWLPVSTQRLGNAEDLAASAAAPARWLLATADDGGVPLTQTHALARAIVREAAERWPQWWDADLFGPPHREMDMPILVSLREGLLRRRLVRRRGLRLIATARGRGLAADPIALLYELATDLGGNDPFATMVAAVIVTALDENECRAHDELVTAACGAAQWGWRDSTGSPPDERGVSWVLRDILCRGEAYGLIERKGVPDGPKFSRGLISLAPAARLVLGSSRTEAVGRTVFVFDAELRNVSGVSARLAVGGHEHMTALHDTIQLAFGWENDHLYSFWLDGEFWGDPATELVIPGAPDTESRTADVPIASLRLKPGARIGYVFDYGDDWRVMLTLRERVEDGSAMPRVAQRRGIAPPQYPRPEEAWQPS
jgi:hypothetical protein